MLEIKTSPYIFEGGYRVEVQRKCEQCTGVLESFRKNRSDNFASVRIGGQLFKLPVCARGVLQEDGKTIVHCENGNRYDPISASTLVVVNLVYDADGTNPVPGLWAPKGRA